MLLRVNRGGCRAVSLVMGQAFEDVSTGRTLLWHTEKE
jgi:hypothetical protein